MMNFDTIVIGAGRQGHFWRPSSWIAAAMSHWWKPATLAAPASTEAALPPRLCASRREWPTWRVVRPSSVCKVGPVKVDFAVAMQRMQDRVDQARSGLESWLGGLQGLRIIKAHGRLMGRDGGEFLVQAGEHILRAPRSS